MKKRLIGLAVGGSAVAVLVGVVGIGLPGASAQDTQTLHFQEQATNVTYVPVGTLINSKQAANQGDYVVFEDPLVNDKKQVIGYNEGECFTTNPTNGTSECPGVTFVFTGAHGFPKGSIQGAGIFIGPPDGSQGKDNADPFLYGTGAFAGAQGTLTGRQLSFTLDDWALSFTR